MRKRITWLACATLLCALLIALPAAQTALASSTDVAKIGDTTYASLQDAVKAVPTRAQNQPPSPCSGTRRETALW